MAALPDKAPAKPRQPRKVLVLAKAAGYVHSCIPLAAKTVEALGARTGAWTTAITYDANDNPTNRIDGGIEHWHGVNSFALSAQRMNPAAFCNPTWSRCMSSKMVIRSMEIPYWNVPLLCGWYPMYRL